MEEFDFNVTQPASTYYNGKITIKAKNHKAAIEKIKKMSQKQLSILIYNWELADDTDANGNIEVWDDGNLIN